VRWHGVNELVLEVLRTFHAELAGEEIAMRLELARQLPPVAGHNGQFHEVIINLVDTGIAALRAIKGERRELTVRTEDQKGRSVIFELEDTGPGIDPNRSDRIFDAFTSTKPDGIGLGLAICQRIVERHNGQISVSPAHPHGCIFRVVLPASSRSSSVLTVAKPRRASTPIEEQKGY